MVINIDGTEQTVPDDMRVDQLARQILGDRSSELDDRQLWDLLMGFTCYPFGKPDAWGTQLAQYARDPDEFFAEFDRMEQAFLNRDRSAEI